MWTTDKRLMALGLAGALFILGGCQQKSPRVYKVSSAQGGVQGPATVQNWVEPQAAFTSVQNPGRFLIKSDSDPAAPASTYHLGPGDVLEVRIQQLLNPHEESLQTVTVDSQGQVYLPVLNHVQASGLTVTQFRQELTQRLGKEFIRNPEVDVKIAQHKSKEVIVLGPSLMHSGPVHMLADSATLLDVIGLAGGIQGEVGPNIEILRGAYRPGMPNSGTYWSNEWKTATTPGYFNRDVVAVSDLFAEGSAQVNPLIYPGDVIKIRPAQEGYVYLSGQVRVPGAKRYYRPLNVMQAISMAGGLSPIAEERECKIVRREPNGQEQVILVDLQKIEDGEHRNLALERNDLISVPINPHKKFWHDVAKLFRTGVRAGVDMTYDAADDLGIPSGGTGF